MKGTISSVVSIVTRQAFLVRLMMMNDISVIFRMTFRARSRFI